MCSAKLWSMDLVPVNLSFIANSVIPVRMLKNDRPNFITNVKTPKKRKNKIKTSTFSNLDKKLNISTSFQLRWHTIKIKYLDAPLSPHTLVTIKCWFQYTEAIFMSKLWRSSKFRTKSSISFCICTSYAPKPQAKPLDDGRWLLTERS